MWLAKRLGLAAAALCVFFIAAEGLSRLAYNPREADRESIFEADPDKIFRLKRSYRGEFSGSPVTTNSRGTRGPDVSSARGPTTRRILVLGDSVSFGHGVLDDEVWPERLRRLLAVAHPKQPVEVLNTATPGNTPYQEFFDLERSSAFEPDLVVLQFTLNDVIEPWQVSRRHGPRGVDYHGVDSLAFELGRTSAFYLALRDLVTRISLGSLSSRGMRERAAAREIYSVQSLIRDPHEPEIIEAWRECLEWIGRIADLCRDRDLELILFASPFGFQLGQEPELARPQQRLASFASERGLVYVDLLDALQGDLLEERTGDRLGRRPRARGRAIAAIRRDDRSFFEEFWLRYFLDHNHYSPAGHDYVAALLQPAVERGLERARTARDAGGSRAKAR